MVTDRHIRTMISAGRKALLSDLRNVMYLLFLLVQIAFILLYICEFQLTGQLPFLIEMCPLHAYQNLGINFPFHIKERSCKSRYHNTQSVRMAGYQPVLVVYHTVV